MIQSDLYSVNVVSLEKYLPEVAGGRSRQGDGEGLVLALPLSSPQIPLAAPTDSSSISWLWNPLKKNVTVDGRKNERGKMVNLITLCFLEQIA